MTVAEQGAVWLDRQGQPIGCVEKLKVLRENDAELRQNMQDAFEDALLMGVAPDAMREILTDMVKRLREPGA
ncbi:hypothetical protein AA101099_1711 [Neoasaia chiangmaiensis NBRC 101099]|uniref:Uncharacterized protein n=1 Tax=Neoasaia chiangmaiensis TaxID=320497 RepID=A0A1U9KR33_9PROT|nr:hypothetical protein [Neoasaia chiangmaiensis]AQS88321.1 hypothetical protein A0U93_10635 [Neoasaia chiangmaiensis]GBR39542.1 hypothetical protein AA101099_1711 [Neoasaia chiangmaiensis NBRC 101099]GEN14631.1 hypothetical protein NCH01_10620 [Neoasaia chiangmaiensis]